MFYSISGRKFDQGFLFVLEMVAPAQHLDRLSSPQRQLGLNGQGQSVHPWRIKDVGG